MSAVQTWVKVPSHVANRAAGTQTVAFAGGSLVAAVAFTVVDSRP